MGCEMRAHVHVSFIFPVKLFAGLNVFSGARNLPPVASKQGRSRQAMGGQARGRLSGLWHGALQWGLHLNGAALVWCVGDSTGAGFMVAWGTCSYKLLQFIRKRREPLAGHRVIPTCNIKSFHSINHMRLDHEKSTRN